MAFVDTALQAPAVTPAQLQSAQQAPIAAGGSGVAGATKQASSTPGVNVPAQPSAQLSAYLAANQPQTQTFSQNIAGTVGGQVNAAGAGIQPAVNAYTGSLYTVPTDQNVNQTVSTAPSTLTPEQTATYQTELAAGSKAPNAANTFEATGDYQSLAQGVQKAVDTANLWNSGNNPASLTTALAPFESGNATAGDKTLDALLISQSPAAYKNITDAVAPAANLQGTLSGATQSADASLQGAIAQDNATTSSATQAAQDYANNLATYLQNAVAQSKQAGASSNAQILADLNAGNLSAADEAALGITPEQGTALSQQVAQANQSIQAAKFGAKQINLTNYLNQTDPSVITAANTATPTQYADIAALQKILGGNAPVEPISSVTADQAGKVPALSTLDYSNALKGAQVADQIATLQQQARAIKSSGDDANSSYAYNHAGGVSAGEFNSYISSLNSQINEINSQIEALAASSPQIGTIIGQTPQTGSAASVQDTASNWIPIISSIGSGLSDFGSFFGI